MYITTILTKVIGSHLVFSHSADPRNKANELYFDSNLTHLLHFHKTQLNWNIFPTGLKQTSCFLSQKIQMPFLCLPSNWSLLYPGYPPTYFKSLCSLVKSFVNAVQLSEYTMDHDFVFIKALLTFLFQSLHGSFRHICSLSYGGKRLSILSLFQGKKETEPW